ncbi:hypothetical protein HF876_10140 [Psychrobacillus sp. BL-248-WT-3]|nr:hypothetical protein [Psychrobacillus sp. BL-248-WT-3]
MDFKVPRNAADISTFSNLKSMRTEHLQLSTAIRNVVADCCKSYNACSNRSNSRGCCWSNSEFLLFGAYEGVTQAGKVSI